MTRQIVPPLNYSGDRVRKPFALWDESWDFRGRPICMIPKPSIIIPVACGQGCRREAEQGKDQGGVDRKPSLLFSAHGKRGGCFSPAYPPLVACFPACLGMVVFPGVATGVFCAGVLVKESHGLNSPKSSIPYSFS